MGSMQYLINRFSTELRRSPCPSSRPNRLQEGHPLQCIVKHRSQRRIKKAPLIDTNEEEHKDGVIPAHTFQKFVNVIGLGI